MQTGLLSMSYSVQMDFRDTSVCLIKILIYVNGFSFFQGIVLWGWGGKNVYLFKLKGCGWVVEVFSVFLFIEQIKSSFLLPRRISRWCAWKCFRVYQEILQEMMSQREKGQFSHTRIWYASCYVYGPLMIYSYRKGEQNTMVPYPPCYYIDINIFNISTPKSDLHPIFSSQYHLYITLRSQKRKWSPTKDALDS